LAGVTVEEGRTVRTRTPKVVAVVLAALFLVAVPATAGAGSDQAPANVFGSVEPIANPVVLDTSALRARDLTVREAFARRLFDCGIVDQVIGVLTSTGAISTINAQNTNFAVTAGGFAGRTNPAYGYTIDDDGPNAANHEDIEILTNSLGYVFSQGSAFLLDGDDPTSFDFDANYVILRFAATPTMQQSAALFETVGAIDPELFATTSSGYTQYGPDYLSLQSFVPDQQFIDGYVAAAAAFGVQYLPIIDDQPGLFEGGAAFPGNNWATNPAGQAYLGRIPSQAHAGLAAIRADTLRVTEHALNIVRRGPQVRDQSNQGMIRALGNLPCRSGPALAGAR
jgi:hypothetical protein